MLSPLILAAGLGLAVPEDGAAEVALLVEAGLPGAGRVGAAQGVRVYQFESAERGNPITEGRLLAALQGIERVIVVGPEAASWAARRLENPVIHFAGGAARLQSVDFQARNWTGSVGYGPGQVLDYARSAGWRRVGVACTPAFAGLLPSLRAVARARGLTVTDKVIGGPPQVPGAVEELMGSSDAFWLLGGPLTAFGGGFDYIVEASLSRQVPVIAPEPGMVGRGAYLAIAPNWKAVLSEAVTVATASAAGEAAWPKSRMSFTEADGSLVLNEVLKKKWGFKRGGVR